MTDQVCKCGHNKLDHDARLPSLPCLVDWYGHVPGCECEAFVPTNLSLLEEKYEQSKEI